MSIFAIVVGWLADIFVTFLFLTVVLTIVAGGGAVNEAVLSRMESPDLQLSTFAVGLAFTGLGGYVAALLAKRRPIAHGVGVGVLAVASSFGVLIAADRLVFTGLSIAGYLLTIPAAAVGGWLRAPARSEPT